MPKPRITMRTRQVPSSRASTSHSVATRAAGLMPRPVAIASQISSGVPATTASSATGGASCSGAMPSVKQ
ncbi:MAG TPA: hypothetical protein VFA73_04735 [Actinomycetota bacterium]|nr:hypothetical protein [Actinomycetota bacterium]